MAQIALIKTAAEQQLAAEWHAAKSLLPGDSKLRQAAFERYIRAGRGFVGVHSATDTEYGWSWYSRLVGAFFRSHPAIQTATVDVADPRHVSTTGLPRRWVRQDEWYNFAKRPAETVRVLARLDEATYSPGDGAMGRDHPISWAHEYDGGRAWYTGGGHTESSYRERARAMATEIAALPHPREVASRLAAG